MELDDLQVVLNLFERNVNKLHANLSALMDEIKLSHQSLAEKCKNYSASDGRLISIHDCLLSKVNTANEHVIKLNFHINLNRNRRMPCSDRSHERKSLEIDNKQGNHTNLDGIEVGGVDSDSDGNVKDTAELLPPRGGKQRSSEETYHQLVKNISPYVIDSIVETNVMHVDIVENSIYVGMWGKDTTPLQKLLACQMQLVALQQIPDFGEIFAVYDAQQKIMPRVVINAPNKNGGYYAYLLDYGEGIHLDGTEAFFGLPKDMSAMPAEAIRCQVHNLEIAHMVQFLYKRIQLRVLANNGKDLEVEVLEEHKTESAVEKELAAVGPKQYDQGIANSFSKETPPDYDEEVHSVIPNPDLVQSTLQLTEEQKAILETVEEGTSNAVKAVLGFNPTDDKRICRFYDPNIGGCFKGSHCRLMHEHFASHGATKDKECIDALPIASRSPKDLGSVVRVLVTYIKSSTQIYVQFIDESTPLVWTKKDVPDSELKLHRAPRPLDIVLALYTDGYYYRAQIIDELDDLFKIFYIDYGNTEYVNIDSMAQCNDARSLKPYRAVGCMIADVKPSLEQSNECVEFLESTLLNEELDVLLESETPDGYVIRLLGSHAEIIKKMIKRGYFVSDDFF
ncbi:uncharacterized protein LOC117570877 [Drosophila albomicans]|uniref:Uncharacterized protein LOC117570877 n=1 Tax=Drosophila albomicans TaxID=7291 RepID=A0A6P8WY24_DROAB|nr:uncharacterized protein LOC117570877 [Drosophila albomicans]XP_051860192.1 uncharacterized protein LOC117570877 [Drosophila albomicans]